MAGIAKLFYDQVYFDEVLIWRPYSIDWNRENE